MYAGVADDHADMFGAVTAADLVIEPLRRPGQMLDSGYSLFEKIFDPAVLDPMSVYVGRMSDKAAVAREFLPCTMIAYIDRGDHRLVAGFLSADIMWLSEPADGAFLAIGNIGTSPELKQRGVRGVGSKLLEACVDVARREVATDGRRLLCVVAEAEPASLGFWKKQGFLLPEGCKYLQPPLEWDDAGSPIHEEVPETLLLAPLDMPKDWAEASMVKGIILAIYENWCLRAWRDPLPAASMLRAEEYVMGRVLDKVTSTMPIAPMALTSKY